MLSTQENIGLRSNTPEFNMRSSPEKIAIMEKNMSKGSD
jgi:hypothetical protein